MEMAIRGSESTCWGRIYWPEIKRLWTSFTNLSNTTATTIILLVCSMSGRTYLIVVTCCV
jgi:hypothetical protein